MHRLIAQAPSHADEKQLDFIIGAELVWMNAVRRSLLDLIYQQSECKVLLSILSHGAYCLVLPNPIATSERAHSTTSLSSF